MNGTYQFVYGGYIGLGFGVFRINGNHLVGAHFPGGKYRGTVSKDSITGKITVAFEMLVKAGVALVQGTSPLEFDSTRTGSFTTPPDFGDGELFKVYIEPGYITLMVKRLPDEYSSFADGMRVTIEPTNESPSAP